MPMQQASSKNYKNRIHKVENVEGRFRPIATIQLCLSWWLYRSGHITRRQLRVYFALHEMTERRRYTQAGRGGRKRKPTYLVEEVASLVGGRGSLTALDELAADLRKLARLGLARMADHAIEFANSQDCLSIDDVAEFDTLWNQIPNRARSVPVPRRTLRALAAGFTKAVTGTLIALMIRSIHWHKREGGFRVDGRTKGSWISETFRLSRRAVTDARAHLIEIGWLIPQETPQILLNRYGNHDLVNVAWSHRKLIDEPANECEESATPEAAESGELASPMNNSLPSSTKKTLGNRKLETGSVPDPQQLVNRNKKRRKEAGANGRRSLPKPSLRSIHSEHLRDTRLLLELYKQAVQQRLIEQGDRGRIDFVAFAERARSRGHRPAALFAWLLRNRKFDFITQADEDAAVDRIRRHLFSDQTRSADTDCKVEQALTDEDRIVRTCCQTGRKFGVCPFVIAKKTLGWTREQWDESRANYELRFGTLD